MDCNFTIYTSPEDFFNKAKSLKQDIALRRTNSGMLWITLNTPNKFNGNWNSILRKFDRCDFTAEASLTDDIVGDLATVDFNEMKWKFQQHLEEGDSIDVERYLAGQERCWCGCRRLPKLKRAVRIYVNFGGNANKSAYELAISGAVGVTLAEMMESVGVAAEIWGVTYTHALDEYNRNYCDMIKLKSQNEYADVGMINYMLGDNGVFRNALFRNHIRVCDLNNADVRLSLGSHVTATVDMLGLTEREKKSSIVVPTLYTVDSARAWLENLIADTNAMKELNEAMVIKDDQEV